MLTVAQAAKRANVTERDIISAVNSGVLSKNVDSNGLIWIDPAELATAFPKQAIDRAVSALREKGSFERRPDVLQTALRKFAMESDKSDAILPLSVPQSPVKRIPAKKKDGWER